MANLKEVRDRITSVKNTQQITKAMKMVSAAKLRRAQQAITEMRPYSDRLDNMLKNILSNLEGDASSEYGVEREVSKLAIVIVTSSKGLCGAFNANVIKQLKAVVADNKDLIDAGNVEIIAIGKKGYEFCKKTYSADLINKDYVDLFNDLSFDHTSQVSKLLMDGFIAKGYDKVLVCYGSFVNPAVQEARTVQYLPVAKIEKEAGNDTNVDYLFEPSKEQLLDELIPTILQTTFQKYLLDTHASEHGARMAAMDSATENANELLKDLKISYNKARQEAITKELSEIVGGAAALGG